jgi:hypothetical protein
MDRLMVDGVGKISQMIAEHEIMLQNYYQKGSINTKKCHVFEQIWLFLATVLVEVKIEKVSMTQIKVFFNKSESSSHNHSVRFNRKEYFYSTRLKLELLILTWHTFFSIRPLLITSTMHIPFFKCPWVEFYAEQTKPPAGSVDSPGREHTRDVCVSLSRRDFSSLPSLGFWSARGGQLISNGTETNLAAGKSLTSAAGRVLSSLSILRRIKVDRWKERERLETALFASMDCH